ncbi:MAG: 16S rRNA (cytidine(1402)-2'-O)-methyltransferase [Oscillospiraceae bacterium]|jgi:16S rRNA (cytidine1402-2'-O)-methyltransferase|nr:16S rRNA (cytidine(1402)-2'-O)-methyltransferase [Oscillospiraceae bacterium]
MAGTLYVVPTPIGHLGDMTERARAVLAQVDFIAAEDTRVTLKLLNHMGVKKPLVSYYEHNRRESGARIAARVAAGETAALVTDAGTPAISDPGEDLVALCAGQGIAVVALPGPCALVTALAVSGLPAGRFCFEGFLAMNKKSRRAHLAALRAETRTMIFYEAPHKLPHTLADLLEALGDRRAAVCRELTKRHEEVWRTTLHEAAAHYAEHAPRGEFVLVVEGRPDTPPPSPSLASAVEQAKEELSGGVSLRDAARRAAERTGLSRSAVYAALVKDERADGR